MIRLSDYLYIPTMAQVLEQNKRERKAQQKRYAAGKIMRTNRDWVTAPVGINTTLHTSLRVLRARARQMAKDAPHFRKFLQMAKINVIGHQGIQLQCRAQFYNGRPNTRLNQKIESEWWQWSFAEHCTVSGKLSWLAAQYLFIETLIRDGEVLVQHLPSDNPWGYSMKFWNPDWLDETYNVVLPNGNRVIMSVEVNADDKPVAYWMTPPPAEYPLPLNKPRNRVRIAADEMIHAFLITEDENQARGVTWFHAALIQGKDLHEYTTGVIQQARVAAHTLGFLKSDNPDEVEFDGSNNENGTPAPLEIDVAPLAMNELPPGYSLQQFDPKQPSQNHAEFKHSMMLDMASALGVNGFSLTGDMGDVNYSSARVGLGEERDLWRMLQTFVATNFCRPVYHRWLQAAFLNSRIELTPREYAELQNPYWRPRGWRYVDPHKEISANVEALKNNLATWTDVLGEQGIDLTEFLETKAAEKKLAEKYGIELTVADNAQKSTPPADDDIGDGSQEPSSQSDELPSYVNGKYS